MSYLEMSVWLGLCGLFILLSGFYSGAEMGLYCVNRLRLRLAVHEGRRHAEALQRLVEQQTSLLFMTLLGTNLANYLAPVCMISLFLQSQLGEREAEFYTTLILTPVIFIFGEVVPKNVFQRQADKYMLRFTWLLAASNRVFRLSGVGWLEQKVTEAILRVLRRETSGPPPLFSRTGLYQLIQESAAEGAFTQTQVFMLERIHRLHAVRVESVMIPRSRTIMLRADASRREMEQTLRQTTFSRLAIYDQRRENVIGVAHILDLLTAPPRAAPADVIKTPATLRRGTTVIEALSILQRDLRRMAIVVDDRHECVGIVTVKDLVEEVVGELAAW